MEKFNTHGGYFAPAGFLRVNEGGRHDENPNGGVQLGVDPNGVPNMVEEGEVIYNDFVYSDNIVADKETLEQFNLPAKYAGKLFSEIADILCDEAEENPLDAVSNNGLNKMLVRLADAQEAQKQAKMQEELQAELEKLTPEELEELDAILAQEEQAQAQMQMQQPVRQEVSMQEEQQDAPEQPVMMAHGGLLRTFADGTPGEIVEYDERTVGKGGATSVTGGEYGGYAGGNAYATPDTGTIDQYIDRRGLLQKFVDSNPKAYQVSRGFDRFAKSPVGQAAALLTPSGDATTALTVARRTKVLTEEGRKLVTQYGDEIAKLEKEIAAQESLLGNVGKKGGPGRSEKEAIKKTIDDLRSKIRFNTKEINRVKRQYSVRSGSEGSAQSVPTNDHATESATEQVAKATNAPESTAGKVLDAVFNPAGRMMRNWKPQSRAGRNVKRAASIVGDGLWYSGLGYGIGQGVGAYDNYEDLHGQYDVDERFALGGPMNVYRFGTTDLRTYPVPSGYRFVAAEPFDVNLQGSTEVIPEWQIGDAGSYTSTSSVPPVVVTASSTPSVRASSLNGTGNPFGMDLMSRYLGTGLHAYDGSGDTDAATVSGTTVAPVQVSSPALGYMTRDSYYGTIPMSLYAGPGLHAYNGSSPAVPSGAGRVSSSTGSGRGSGTKKTSSATTKAAAPAREKFTAIRSADLPLGYIKADNRYGYLLGDDVIQGKKLPEDKLVPKEVFDANAERVRTEMEEKYNPKQGDGEFDWQKYAGVGFNLASAIHNLFAPKDTYNTRRATPHYPNEASPAYRDPLYTPTDRNQMLNQLLASHAGNVRGALNSGVSPSIPSLLVALDNSATSGIGKSLTTVDEHNAGMRNNILGMINQLRKDEAEYNYRQAAARAAEESMIDRFNINLELGDRIRNYQAEQQHANAVSQPLGNVAQALSDMSLENRRKKLATASSLYGYGYDNDDVVYVPVSRKALGGLLLKPYTK